MKTRITLWPKTLDPQSVFYALSLGLIWVFTLVGIGRSLLHIFLPDGGAQLIATIPLDAYTQEAQQVIVGMFAFWGLSQLLSSLAYVYILLKRKNWLPFAWFLLLIEYASRWMIGQAKPFETVSTAPGAIGNYVFMGLSVVMLVWYVIDYKKLVL